MSLNRNDALVAREMIERLLPDSYVRNSVLQFLVIAIQQANSIEPAGWGLTLKKSCVRLNVGKIETIAIYSNWIHLILIGPKPRGLENIVGVELNPKARTQYASVPGSFPLGFPAGEFPSAQPLVVKAHRDLIKRAALTAKSSTWAASHSPGVLRYLETETGTSLPDPSYRSQIETAPHYLARISFNSGGWQCPIKNSENRAEEDSYVGENGFGHEDWLFRKDWIIDGWRYGFIQGVNRSHSRLVAEKKPFDLSLFTKDQNKRRRYVARILAVECLSDVDAGIALEAFKARGWHKTMLQEIENVGGNVKALEDTAYAKHVLNLRFKWENIQWFNGDTYASQDDPVYHLDRYNLSNVARIEEKDITDRSTRLGNDTLPVIRPYMRQSTSAFACDPQHARMQAQLMKELKAQYPHAEVLREEGFVDVTVRTPQELILFEIKSNLEPRTVIREALGQILEYAYHPTRNYTLPVKLVIVGRCPLPNADANYIDRLNEKFNLAIQYRVVSD